MPQKNLEQKDKGLIIVYTGEGKGKTTAALGLILRAKGYGKKTLLVQFGKNQFSGELKSLKLLKIKIIQGGKGFVGILGDQILFSEHKKSARQTFNLLYKEVISKKWDVVVADEIIGAVTGKVLPLSLVLKLIQDKPEKLDLVLTGRGAVGGLIKKADLVTEMKCIKHPFEKGTFAKLGIDY